MDVNGKKAVVFGGTSGIGKSAVEMLAAKGCEVIAISRAPSKAGTPPAGVTLKQCDVRDEAAMEAMFAEIGSFDILVSAATGGDRAIGPFMSMDMAGYRASFDKLWGYANVVRYGAGNLPDDGCIVLVSGAPARNCKPGQISLSSVGGAVEAMVRALAREIAPKRINVMSPGTIDTPMVGLQGDERKAFYEKVVADNLIKRAGSPDECGQAIMFLIENDFVTGTTVDVDGGWILS